MLLRANDVQQPLHVLNAATVRVLLNIACSPTIVCLPWRRYAVPPAVESLRCVPFRLLLQHEMPEEGLDHETQAPLQEVHGFEAVNC